MKNQMKLEKKERKIGFVVIGDANNIDITNEDRLNLDLYMFYQQFKEQNNIKGEK